MVIKPIQIETMCKKIEEKLKYTFSPIYLVVLNESDQHNAPKNIESHFQVILVTEKFITQKMVDRHKAVYQLLANELSNSIHALELHTYTPSEWKKRQEIEISSPTCYSLGK
ncbi:MAG: BolA/IbaG family iron-sulfur metabolism protein [Arsenophonus sp.]